MQIRGAPAIASLAALAFAQHLLRALRDDPPPVFFLSVGALESHIVPILDFLFTARPTAVNLGAATRRLYRAFQAAVQAGKDVRAVAQILVDEGKKVADEDVGRNKEMAKWGGEWLVEQAKGKGETGEGLNVLTVCNTGSLATSVRSQPSVTDHLHTHAEQGYGTALGLITYLHETAKLARAYYTQTAPYHQGSRYAVIDHDIVHC